jgi:uncharacterized repeat protein (TIGR03806 family)
MRYVALLVLCVVSMAAIDTSRLMAQPDSHAIFGVEPAFPKLQFARPVDLTHARDGSNRLFVVEQDGRICVFANDPTANDTKIFLDLRDVVRRAHNEEGMLGLAFHPKFRDNGEFFVFYSVTPRGSVISRFRVSKDDPDRADPASEQKLLEFGRPYGNHNGGCLKFGPDGCLYISVGDGGLGNDPHGNGQNLDTVLATILRIDADRKDAGKNYAIPKDNPFVDRGGKVRGEIWAYGLRNSWRMSFDRLTGALWAGDVGQDHFEEINLIVRGGNYGWNLREGKHPRDPRSPRDSVEHFIDPVFQYPRVEGKSITGGFVYRGKRLPDLAGTYVYADFMSGNIWGLRLDGKKATANHKIAHTSLLISSFGEDEAGELYFTAFDGKIHQIRRPAKSQGADAFPRTLTETGLFRSVKDHTPAPGLIPYDVNVKLWSDGAVKERFLVLPRKASVVFKEKEKWNFPVGTVIVKTFFLPTDTTDPSKRRRLETRLWLHSPRGWEGYTYLWNDEQTDATLLADWPFTKEYEIKTPAGPIKQKWYFPSRSDCQACHTHNVGFVLGWNTRQLNRVERVGTMKVNQIERFKRLGLFTQPVLKSAAELESYPDWDDKNTSLDARARAYLDVNCSLCHSPGGFGTAGGSRADLHYHNDFAKAFAVPPKPLPDAKRWIVPGHPEQSQLIQRMTSREPKDQMPPLATYHPDREGLGVLRQWIKSMESR